MAAVAAPTLALAEFAATLKFGDLPTEVVANIKLMILDALGCAIAATTLGDGCRETIAVMRSLGGPPESTIIGTPDKVSAPNAAFANGALVHALNYDPIGSEIGHVGVVCLAAPLAIAEAIETPGTEFLMASAVACEFRTHHRGDRSHRQTAKREIPVWPALELFRRRSRLWPGAGARCDADAKRARACFDADVRFAPGRAIGRSTRQGDLRRFPDQAGVLAALLSKQGLGAECDIVGEPAGLYPMIYGGQCDLKR